MTGRIPARIGRRPWLRVAAALFAIAWGGNEFTPLLVLYKRTDGLGTGVVDVLLGAYVVGIIPALLLGGSLSDRWGRRPLLLPAPFVAVVGSLLLAVGHASPGVLLVGRVLSGVAIGLAMAVGTSWVQELSRAPFEPETRRGSGARRASMALTAGFALGAAVAAALAQWGPWPTGLPYVVNVLVTVVPLVALFGAPETRPAGAGQRGRLRDDLRVPLLGHRRFWLVVVPVAPWVFGSAATAYAILPTITTGLAGTLDVAYAGLLCLLGLGCGFAAQQLSRRVVTRASGPALVVALVLVSVGMALAALAAAHPHLWLTVPAAVVLGVAYGLGLVAGLTEVQRIARPDDLAGLTAVFYALTYVGFFAPAVLAALAGRASYTVLLGAGVVMALVCLVVVAVGARRVPATGGSRGR
jgi:MFS family permease